MPTPDVFIDGATTEIPFIPASQRQATKPEIIDDTIIVVGQRKQKRKRPASLLQQRRQTSRRRVDCKTQGRGGSVRLYERAECPR
jgi:hypothetical protein